MPSRRGTHIDAVTRTKPISPLTIGQAANSSSSEGTRLSSADQIQIALASGLDLTALIRSHPGSGSAGYFLFGFCRSPSLTRVAHHSNQRAATNEPRVKSISKNCGPINFCCPIASGPFPKQSYPTRSVRCIITPRFPRTTVNAGVTKV